MDPSAGLSEQATFEALKHTSWASGLNRSVILRNDSEFAESKDNPVLVVVSAFVFARLKPSTAPGLRVSISSLTHSDPIGTSIEYTFT
jgi:hypothetical protein